MLCFCHFCHFLKHNAKLRQKQNGKSRDAVVSIGGMLLQCTNQAGSVYARLFMGCLEAKNNNDGTKQICEGGEIAMD